MGQKWLKMNIFIQRRKEKFFHEGRRKGFQKTKNPGEKNEFATANER